MKILSVFTIDPANAAEPPSEAKQQQMGAFIEELRSQGMLIDTGGAMPGMLELTVSRRGAKTTVSDGPFTESKEVVGGFALLDVANRDEAVALSNRFLDLVGDATCHLHEVELA